MKTEDKITLIKLNNAINEAKQVHADLACSLGIYFGYPICCIVNFCDDILKNRDSTKRNIDGSGFLPCREHFVQIQLGNITLESLIKDRICQTQFFMECIKSKDTLTTHDLTDLDQATG